MTKFFTSDHHFFHRNIIKYCDRPFRTVEEMNEAMIVRWNNVVRNNDIVYYLGDLSLEKPNKLHDIVAQLNGYKILIPGNHDYCFPGRKGYEKYVPQYLDIGFDEVHTDGFWRYVLLGDIPTVYQDLPWTPVMVSHFPYKRDTHDQRYREKRPPDRGDWLLCGHIHEKWHIKDKMINVGVDVNNFTPVSEHELIRMIYENSGLWRRWRTRRAFRSSIASSRR